MLGICPPVRRLRAGNRRRWLRPALVAVLGFALIGAACGGRSSATADARLPAGVEAVAFETVTVPLRTLDGRSQQLALEVADTFTRRTRGLKYRTALPPDAGMLFAYPALTTSPFWNKDTPLALDIAFLEASGQIVSILRLEALSPALVAPDHPYLYAVELPAGWFAARSVVVGDRFLIPSTVIGRPE